MSKIKAGYIYTDIDNITDELFETLDIVYYAFLLTNGTGTKTNANADDGTLDTRYIRRLEQIILPKARQHNTKVLLSINGGYNLVGDLVAMDFTGINNFVDKLIGLIDLYDFDGYDIAIENYYTKAINPFRYFIKRLSSKLKEKNKMLTATFRAGKGGLPYFNDKTLAHYLDYVNVMTYAMDSNPLNYSSALYPVVGKTSPGCSWQEAFDLYKNWVPLDKLIFGFATYVQKKDKSFHNQSIRDTFDVEYLHFDNEAKVPYYKFEDLDFATFEDEQSVNLKLDFIEANNLAGIFYWESGFDDGRLLNEVKIY